MFHRVVLLALVSVFSVIAGPDDDFVLIYQLIQQTDSQRELGQLAQARAGYLKAQELLKSLKRNHPDWNDRVVAYRLRYVAEKLESIPEQPATPAVSVGKVEIGNPVPTTSTEPANEVVAQFSALNQEISALRIERQRLEAKLREALTAQPAPVDPRELQHAVERITQLQATNKVLFSRLETQEAERKGLVDKVLLEEAKKALGSANQQLSDQKRKSSELEQQRGQIEVELKRLREGDLKGLRAENTTLKSQVDALQSDTERGRQIASLTERLSNLQVKFEESKHMNDSLLADRKKLEQQLQDLRVRQSEEGIVRIKQLQTDLALAKAEAQKHETTATQLQAKLAVETSTRNKLETENHDLVARVKALTQQADSMKLLQAQLNAEQRERVEVEKQLKAAEQQLAALNAKAKQTSALGGNTTVQASSGPNSPLVSQIQVLNEETARLREAMKNGQARQAELTAVLTESQSTARKLEREKKELTKSLEELRSTPAQSLFIKSQQRVQALESRIRSLEKDRKEMETKLMQASEKSKTQLQVIRSIRIGNARQDAQMFRDLRNIRP